MVQQRISFHRCCVARCDPHGSQGLACRVSCIHGKKVLQPGVPFGFVSSALSCTAWYWLDRAGTGDQVAYHAVRSDQPAPGWCSRGTCIVVKHPLALDSLHIFPAIDLDGCVPTITQLGPGLWGDHIQNSNHLRLAQIVHNSCVD